MKKLLILLVLFDFVLASAVQRKRKSTEISEFSSSASISSINIVKPSPVGVDEVSSSVAGRISVEPCEKAEFLVEVLETETEISLFTLAIPDNFEFPEDYFGTFSEVVWDRTIENEWTLSTREFKQFLATAVNISVSDILDHINLFEGQFAFDRNWPGLTDTTANTTTTRLSLGFQAFAFKLLLSEGQSVQFEKLCKADLFDMTRPIYEHSNGIFYSFLSFSLKNGQVPNENLLLIIKYSSKKLLNWPSSDGILPLNMAIRWNRLDLVQKLVEAGADINMVLSNIFLTPFMVAIKLNFNEIVDYLINTGKVNPNIILKDFTNVLVLFAKHFPLKFHEFFCKIVQNLSVETFFQIILNLFDSKNKKIYELIVVSVLKGDFQQFWHPIFSLAYKSAQTGEIGFLVLLEYLGISLKNLRDSEGFKLIHLAAKAGNIEICRFLIEKGTPVDSSTNDRFTPIQIAYQNNHKLLVKELIAFGAFDGLANVLQSAITDNEIEILKTYLNWIANLNYFNLPNGGFNLITWSIAQDRPNILQLLHFSMKIDFRIPDAKGRTVFNFVGPLNSSFALAFVIQFIIQKYTQIN